MLRSLRVSSSSGCSSVELFYLSVISSWNLYMWSSRLCSLPTTKGADCWCLRNDSIKLVTESRIANGLFWKQRSLVCLSFKICTHRDKPSFMPRIPYVSLNLILCCCLILMPLGKKVSGLMMGMFFHFQVHTEIAYLVQIYHWYPSSSYSCMAWMTTLERVGESWIPCLDVCRETNGSWEA